MGLEKLSYYLGGVGVLLILGVVYYFIQGKKNVEEALKKQIEDNAQAAAAEAAGGYILCPSGDGDNPPNILISDPDGQIEGKINTVVPRVTYVNYPKTEEEREWHRRDFVIQMIVADGGTAF